MLIVTKDTQQKPLSISDNFSTFTSMKEQYLKGAIKIANKICTEAIWHKDYCNWVTLSSEQHFTGTQDYAKMMGAAFYDGIAGVVHFLSSVYSLAPNAILKTTITGAINSMLAQEKKDTETQKMYGKLGFHTGWPGIAVALWNTGEVMEENNYKILAESFLQKCIDLQEEHYGIDVIDGIAGSIPVFLYFYGLTKKERYLQFAIKIGDALLAKAKKEPNGLSWTTMPDIQHNLTGYGHGTSGMAHAFAELYAVTKENNYLEIVDEIIQYENSHYQKEEGNWPDFRSFAMQSNEGVEATKPTCSCAWCHGAPGIGMARLRCYAITKNDAYLEDAKIAIATTEKVNKIQYGFNFSLCHGLLGNSELLCYATEVLEDNSYLDSVKTIADDLVANYIMDNKILPSGLQSTAPVLDFMLGESGMGYFLLRLYNGAKFKNMLLFIP
jgi:lantibiotic biosynthesis protein